MKRMMCTCIGLLASAVASAAEPTELGVTIQKDTPYIVAHYGVFSATAASDVAGAEYRFSLEPMSPVRSTLLTRAWGAATANFELGPYDVPAGEYRLLVAVRDPATPGVVLSRTQPLTVLSRHEGDLITVDNEAKVLERYAHAQQALRDAIAEMKQRVALSQDVTDLCTALGSSADAIATLINPEGEEAPEGGPAYRDGAADNPAGAIGIEALGVCSQPDNPSVISFAVNFPAYEDLQVPLPTVVISYTD